MSMGTMKNSYELSIWQDVVVNKGQGDKEYFTEEKIAVLSSDVMTSPVKAFDVTLKATTTGDKTLTFNILRKYKNEEGELVDNPLVDLLVNERKIKLRDGKPYPFSDTLEELSEKDDKEIWTDFVIKNISVDKNSYKNTYTAKESFVNELGKNGWSVLLNTELENNYGSLRELGDKILEGSGWTISPDSYVPTENTIEPLFTTQTSTNVRVYPMLGGDSIVIPLNATVYVFYSDLVWNDSAKQWRFKSDVSTVQIMYKPEDFNEDDVDDDRVIVANSFEYTYQIGKGSLRTTNIQMTGLNGNQVFHGRKIVEQINTVYDDNLDKYVQEYVVTSSAAGAPVGTTVRGYTETEYLTSEIVSNKLTNTQNFVNTAGWMPMSITDGPGLATLPIPQSNDPGAWIGLKPTNYLVLPYGRAYYNSGPANSFMNLVQDDVYVLRMKARGLRKGVTDYGTNASNVSQILSGAFAGLVYQDFGSSGYTMVSNEVSLNGYAADDSNDPEYKGYGKRVSGRTRYSESNLGKLYTDSEGYIYTYLKVNKSIRSTDARVSLRIDIVTSSTYWDLSIADIQLFEYHEDSNNVPIFLGDIPNGEAKSKQYFYRNLGRRNNVYLSSNPNYYKPKYRDGYESVRHLELKESTYFNNINTLAQLFEVWVRFHVTHNKDGRIRLNSNNEPIKEVIFSQFAPNGETMNWAGFKYGINIRNIKRAIDSNKLATKIIVKNNNQKYAQDGMASIARAKSNPTSDNEIFNFNYYINQGLLDYTQVLADLYGMSSSDLSYIYEMGIISRRLMTYAKQSVAFGTEISIAKGFIEMYEEAIESANSQIGIEKGFYNGYNDNDSRNKNEKKQTILQLEAQKRGFEASLRYYRNRLSNYESSSDFTQDRIKQLQEEKKALKGKLYKKYARYIQEGTWIDEKYIDDELYYLDAMKVASTSSFPKVSYTLSVLDVEGLEEYQAYSFQVGERTYIQDTDFFGWKIVDVPGAGTVKTPFKMEVVISDKTTVFDNPGKTTITIKNYKNQHQELFQKMAAATTQLQYQSGSYDKINEIADPMGEINITSLEKAMQNNAFVLSSATNQQVKWDSGRGIEITDTTNTSFKLRLTSGGLFMTTDAGRTWINGINASGINTKLLVAGQIDANRIHIVNGIVPTFRWDSDGISAFYNTKETYDASRYVRFNQYGLFGTTNGLELNQALLQAESYDERLRLVKEHSNFSLTWDGLMLSYQDGAVSLSSGDGLEIFNPMWRFPKDTVDNYAYVIKPNGIDRYTEDDMIPLASLGRFYDLQNSEPQYGLRMRNKKGEITLKTTQDGDLWLANKMSVGYPETYELFDYEKVPVEIERTSKNLVFSVPKQPVSKGTLTIFVPLELEDKKETRLYRYHYSPSEFAKENDKYVFKIPAMAFDEELTLASGTYEMQYPVFRRSAHRYLGLGAQIDAYDMDNIDGEFNPIILHAGNVVDKDSPFIVYSDGTIVAHEARISGEINARAGNFTGEITVGNSSGINGAPDAKHAFWAGYFPDEDEENEVEPYFYVTPDGRLVAQNAIIHGTGVFDGEIHSTGVLTGEINANSGQILGPLYFGSSGQSYIGQEKDSDILLNINQKTFAVGSDGDIYADSLMLVRNNAWLEEEELSKQYVILIGNKASSEYHFEIYNSSTTVSQEQRLFGVTSGGSVLISGTLTTGGDLTFAGSLVSTSNNLKIDGQNGSIISKVPSVNGWGIYDDGSAYFSNITVRGKIESAVFSYDEKSSVGGDLFVSPTMFLTEPLPLDNTENGLYLYTLPTVVESNVWLNIDAVVVNIYGYEVEGIVEYPLLKISKEVFDLIPELDANSLPMGTQIISTSTKTNSILLSAKEAAGSYISMRGPRDEGERASVLIGNLTHSQLPPSAIDLFGANLGYGLYANNAFLTGKLYLPNAGVTNEEARYYRSIEEDGKQIRFWAGASGQEMEEAPFIVTQDGSLYALQGIFSGRIEAEDSSFSGLLRTAGMVVDNQNGNHLFVTRPYEGEEPTKEDYIIDISEEGLDIWQGGLNIYSDYYGGWRGSNKTSNRYPLYGYDEELNPDPWRIFTIQDYGLGEDHTPRISSVHQHVWFKDRNKEVGSTRLHPGHINFYKEEDVMEESYNNIEDRIWKAAYGLQIGANKIDGSFRYGLHGADIAFSHDNTVALAILPKQIKATQGTRNVSRTKVYGYFDFGDVMQISQELDGIIFTYIGKE